MIISVKMFYGTLTNLVTIFRISKQRDPYQHQSQYFQTVTFNCNIKRKILRFNSIALVCCMIYLQHHNSSRLCITSLDTFLRIIDVEYVKLYIDGR